MRKRSWSRQVFVANGGHAPANSLATSFALMRDTGMRNERELFQMRIDNLDWNNRTIFVPDSKTREGRGLVPMSRRVLDILKKRCGTRTYGWVFPSKRSASGHLRSVCKLFRQARNEAGLPKEMVLYCARHDYGTRVLMRTGNLAAVMKTMGHRDVKTASVVFEGSKAYESTEARKWNRRASEHVPGEPARPIHSLNDPRVKHPHRQFDTRRP